ncbi:MAG: hypothetical protein ABI533_05160 [Betaproteobacteria bacterium]
MRSVMVSMLAAVALGGAALAASAQQPAAPAAVAAPALKHACAKPGEFPGNLASDNQRRAWQKSYVDYTDCLKKFINDEQALAEPHVKASNDAINEYNAGVKAYNAEVEKAKGN